MKNVTPEQLTALKNAATLYHTVDLQIGSTDYYFTDADTILRHNNTDYLPGVISNIPEIEITSDLRMNGIDLELLDPLSEFTAQLLSQPYMNKPVKILEIYLDSNNVEIYTLIAFQGFISDHEIDYENGLCTVTSSSIWADYDRISGIRTNSQSQQRFYPSDTSFDHAAVSRNKIYWGKESPTPTAISSGGRFLQPEEQIE